MTPQLTIVMKNLPRNYDRHNISSVFFEKHTLRYFGMQPGGLQYCGTMALKDVEAIIPSENWRGYRDSIDTGN